MRLKSFYGPNLTEAMRAVREALGEDAIIVATRDDDMGGIRVTAAIDDVAPAAPTHAAKYSAPIDDGGSQAIEIIADALTRHQAPSHIAEKLLATATQFANDDPVLALGAAFDTHFRFQPIVDDKPEKQLILIGPPGVGKTLCIAKFATKATLSKRAVSVVSADIERAGGMEQLAAFTRLLKLNLIEIEDAHALRDVVSLRKDNLVYIDTPGRNPFDEQERHSLHELVKAVGGEATLVIPAGLDGSEAVDMANEFRKIGATRILFTRLEMTRRLGSMLRIAFDAHMPFANFSLSCKVTEPPQPMNPVALARLVLNRHEAAQEIKTAPKLSTR